MMNLRIVIRKETVNAKNVDMIRWFSPSLKCVR